MSNLISSYQKLDNYVRAENYEGFDPYDTLNCSIPLNKFGKWAPVIAIQIQKRNPFNIRKLLGIKKETNPKAIGLFLHSYSLRYQHGETNIKTDIDQLFYRLLELRTKGYEEYCWGYNFDWASPKNYISRWSPTIVVSGFIAKGIYEYYMATSNPKALSVLISIADFITTKLHRSEDDSGICFSYSTLSSDCCYNASMLGCELFSRLYSITNDHKYLDLAKRTADFVVAKQHNNGSWKYSINIDSGEERNQIDFHQGYILDSLHYFIKYTDQNNAKKYQEALVKGANFYYNSQFHPSGRSYWRLPKKWPVEIHNQSQGIITLSRLSHLNKKYLDFARVIASWTIDNMFDAKKRYFYYKKYPSHIIRTPMMRWSQAWMHLALTEVILNTK